LTLPLLYFVIVMTHLPVFYLDQTWKDLTLLLFYISRLVFSLSFVNNAKESKCSKAKVDCLYEVDADHLQNFFFVNLFEVN